MAKSLKETQDCLIKHKEDILLTINNYKESEGIDYIGLRCFGYDIKTKQITFCAINQSGLMHEYDGKFAPFINDDTIIVKSYDIDFLSNETDPS